MFICIRQLSFGAFCKKIFHKNELQFLPESRALALKKFKKPPHFVPIKKKSLALRTVHACPPAYGYCCRIEPP